MSFQDIDLQWFAAEDEGRTEEPSEYRLRKAREEEGRVPKSQDLSSSIVFFVTALFLVFLAKTIFVSCTEIMRLFFTRCTEENVASPAFAYIFFRYFFKIVLPVALSGIVAAVVSNIVQNRGFLFTVKAIAPKFNKIIPRFGEYFKNTLFSLKGVFSIVKSLGKVAVIIIVAYVLLRKNIPELLMAISNGTVVLSVSKIASVAARLILIAAVIFILISIPDYFVNRREFMESMKMTKYEVKQEYKEMEGDPEVKGRLEQAQRQMLSQNMPKAVRESDVVITNPTHFAVSMKYERGVDDAPKVTAKGADEIAFQMRRIASESNVPIVENRPLARGLYTDTEVGDIIPDKYLRVLADVYAEIMKYTSKK